MMSNIKSDPRASLPIIDGPTGEVINYIFSRFSGIVLSMKYTADSVATLDAIRAEYTYALIRHGISEVDILNRAIEMVADRSYKFLPTPGEFIEMCKEARKADPNYVVDNPEWLKIYIKATERVDIRYSYASQEEYDQAIAEQIKILLGAED